MDRKAIDGLCREEPSASVRRELPQIERIDDLLSPEEQQQLYADLAEISRRRRRAEAAARHLPMA